jgi:methionine-rich copper-binding protein CopC
VVGADLFALLAEQAKPLVQSAGGPEAVVVLAALARGREVLMSTATAYLAVTAAYGASLWWLMSSRAATVELGETANPLPVPTEPPEPAIAAIVAGAVLAGLGALFIAFGAVQFVVPHARYLGSTPSPGESHSESPKAIVLRFNHALDPASSLSVRPADANGVAEAGAAAGVATARLDPDDSARKTLRAESLGLGNGLYRVDWRAVTLGQTRTTYGSFYFGVGVAVPPPLAGSVDRPFRDAGGRGYRAAVLSGAIFLVLAALLARWATPR